MRALYTWAAATATCGAALATNGRQKPCVFPAKPALLSLTAIDTIANSRYRGAYVTA